MSWWIHLGLAGIALFWVVTLLRTVRAQRDLRWRLTLAAPVAEHLPRLQVVIPARNEAGNIAACVEAVLASGHPDLEVLVFDDGSVDGTAELAHAAGARVVHGGGELPEGWKGKPWALERARAHLSADWVLFLDADVRVVPGSLARIHTHALAEKLDFLTGFGRLVMVSFWEQVVQPSVGGLILAGNDLTRVNNPRRPEDLIANGQLILVRREAYDRAGGHAAVKGDILDDVGLARAFLAAGCSTRCLFMRELFSCRMYTSLRELWLGWTKNLYAGLHHRPHVVLLVCGFLVVDILSPYLYAPLGLWLGEPALVAWGIGLVLLMHGVRFHLDGIFGQDRRYGLLQALGTVVLIGMLLDSLRRSRTGAVEWKGRRYRVRPEDDTLAGLGR